MQARENVTVRWDVGLNRKKLAFFTIPRDEAQLRLAPGTHSAAPRLHQLLFPRAPSPICRSSEATGSPG
jgi:RNA helicase UPF1, 1B domain